MSLNGIDVASYQAGLNPARVPCDFVIVKATQGWKPDCRGRPLFGCDPSVHRKSNPLG